MTRLCNYCSRPAEFSIVTVVSSIGISKRLQKCSHALTLCDSCLQSLMKYDGARTRKLLQLVNNAYTDVSQRLSERSQAGQSTTQRDSTCV